jgi:outer membrane protein assembly factor BamB
MEYNGQLKTIRFFPLFLIFIFFIPMSCNDDIDSAKAGTPPPSVSGVPAGSSRDWPQWRGPAHDGVSQDADFDPLALEGIDDPVSKGHPRLVWKNKIGVGYAGVAVAGDYAYTMGFERTSGRQGNDIVYCLREGTGEIAWTYEYPCSAATYTGPRAVPLVRDGSVYTLSWDGQLYRLDAFTGRLVWSVNVKTEYGLLPREEEFGFIAPPVIQDNILLLNAREWGVALDRRTGAKVWESPKAMSGYAPPVPFVRDGRSLAAVFGAAKLYVVAIDTGAVVASADWPTHYQGNFADPIVVGDDILVSSTYEQGYGLFRLGPNGLTRVYRLKGLGAQMAAGVAMGGYYYGHDFWYYYSRGGYRCLEIATGKTRWMKKMGMGSVIAVRNTLLLLTEYGRLIAAEARPDAFKQISACQLGVKRKGEWFTPPTFARSRLYVRNHRGDVLCLDLGKRR